MCPDEQPVFLVTVQRGELLLITTLFCPCQITELEMRSLSLKLIYVTRNYIYLQQRAPSCLSHCLCQRHLDAICIVKLKVSEYHLTSTGWWCLPVVLDSISQPALEIWALKSPICGRYQFTKKLVKILKPFCQRENIALVAYRALPSLDY